MKFTLSWLRDHLDTEASVAEIADALTDLGLEVEEVVNPLDALGAFTVGLVKQAEKHPDADRLRVCQVETDDGMQQIICGAPNAREGIRVVVAKPGMYIPGIDTTIQVGKIRGIESHGMMCSEREMELSEEHDGIIELPGEPPVGMKFTDWLAENDPEKVDPMIQPARGDKRFKDADWSENPMFDFLKQTYLLNAKWLRDELERAEGLDAKERKKINLIARNFIEATSPSNFPGTNPAVIRTTIEEEGENLARGLENLVRDLDRGHGNLLIRQTDMDAFSVGENMAISPGKVVFENRLF